MRGLLTFGILYVIIVGDKLLEIVNKPVFRAFIDSSTHALIGLLSWSIIIFKRHRSESLLASKTFESLLCFLFAAIIDLDHFATAKSFNIKSALQLGDKRPILHCTSIWIVLFSLSLIISKVCGAWWVGRGGWLVWVGVLSHHLRDASRRGLWLWPLGSTPPLPYPLYVASVLALPHISAYLINRNDIPVHTSSILLDI